MDSIEKLSDESKNGFCYLGDRLMLVVVVKRQLQQE